MTCYIVKYSHKGQELDFYIWAEGKKGAWYKADRKLFLAYGYVPFEVQIKKRS